MSNDTARTFGAAFLPKSPDRARRTPRCSVHSEYSTPFASHATGLLRRCPHSFHGNLRRSHHGCDSARLERTVDGGRSVVFVLRKQKAWLWARQRPQPLPRPTK